MKKIIALALSLVMLCMLTVPALAAGTDYEDFLADFDRWWAEDYWAGSYYTWEEYQEYNTGDGYTKEELMEEFYQYWQEDMAEASWKADYLAAHPGAMEQLRAKAYDYFAEHYAYYDSAEEYMEWHELTEAEFMEKMAEYQLNDLYRADLARQAREEEIRALGGVPGQLNVMVNGRFVNFPDAVPAIVNDRTMVPFRALIEALGGEVGFDGKVYGSLNGTDLVLVPGSPVMTVTRGGESVQVEMDCAPYIAGDRTFVPVRFVCEAFGYAVGWDSEYSAAVITDTRSLADAANEKFTVINRVLANQAVRPGDGQSLRSTLTGDMTCTLPDSLNGDTVLTASLAAEMLQNAGSLSGSGTFTLSDTVLDLLLTDEELDAEQEEVLRSALRQGDARFILNADGEAWVRSTLLELAGAGGGDVWCAVPVNTDVNALFALDAGAVTVGEALAGTVDVDSVYGWSAAQDALAELASAVGDDCFTKVNGVDTLRLGEAELDPDGELEGQIKELSLTLTVDSRGKTDFSLAAQTLPQYTGDASMRLELNCGLSDGTVTLTALFHVSNAIKLELTLTGTGEAADEAPLSAPPAGEPVLENASPLN